MARKKKKTVKTSTTKCKFCMKSFSNLGLHFYNNPLCAEFNLNNDLTLVTTDDHISPPVNDNTDNQDTATYDFQHSNDVHSHLFQLNDNKKSLSSTSSNININNIKSSYSGKNLTINNQQQRSEQDTNTTLSSDSSNVLFDDDSINSNVIIETTTSTNNNYLETCTQIDAMIEILKPQHSIETNLISNNEYCIYNFTNFRVTVLKQMIHFAIDHGMVASIKLLKIMKDGNIANYHYKQLINWHLETLQTTTQQECTPITSIIKSRKVVIEHLHQLLYHTKHEEFSMKPIHRIIQLPSMRTSKISKFDLKSSLASLLTDPDLMRHENIYLGDKTYQNPIKYKTTTYEDIHHGNAFHNAYELMCKEPYDVLVPIIPFIDGTPIDPYGRNKLEVVMFTLGIFKQNIRNKTKAWQIAGYIPDLCNENSGQSSYDNMSNKKQNIAKRKDYHAMLRYILEDFINLEQSEGIIMEFPNESNTELIKYRFKFVILFIIGDAVGHDKLCDRFASYGKKVNRICRDCNCPSDQLNNPKFNCTFTKRSTLQSMSQNDLYKISYYKIENNALNDLTFGGNIYGMNGCLPPEPLHQLNQGVFKKLLDHFDDCITSKGDNMLDKVVKYISMNCHRQSDRQFPNIDIFKDGLEKCQLSGSEIVHKVFMLYITLIQTYVINCLPTIEANCQQRYKTKSQTKVKLSNPNDDDNDSQKDTNIVSISRYYYTKVGESKQNIVKWIQLLEATLCLDAWVNQNKFRKNDLKCIEINDSRADIALRNYLHQYTSLIKDDMGNGTQTSKIHWLLHIPKYLKDFGPPKAYNGQIPEHCLSPLVKDAARRTQLRPSTIVEQSCERYYEQIVIQRSYDILQHQNVIPKKEEEAKYIIDMKRLTEYTGHRTYVSHGQYSIFIDENHKFKEIIWNNDVGKTKHVTQNQSLIQAIIDRLHFDDYQLDSNTINCVTCISFMDPHNLEKKTFRADPYYYKRPWHDWCISNWQIDDNNESTNCVEIEKNKYPSRIMMIIDTKDMFFQKNISHLGQYLAVVKATEKDTRSTRQCPNNICSLIETYEIDNFVRIIGFDSIISDCFVIPDIENVITTENQTTFEFKNVIMLQSKQSWSEKFLESKWI